MITYTVFARSPSIVIVINPNNNNIMIIVIIIFFNNSNTTNNNHYHNLQYKTGKFSTKVKYMHSEKD